jgi:hypothetical protein
MIRIMKNLPLFGLFFLGVPWLLFWSFYLISGSDIDRRDRLMSFVSPEMRVEGAKVFAALPEASGEVDFMIGSDDARTLILADYLDEFDSPLSGLEEVLVQAADTYNLDFRLLVAIARQESGLCRFIPTDSYNCWGWGIHERGTLGFRSFNEGIWTVARGLRKDYFDDGLISPKEIMGRYTPSSNGSWAFAVEQFIEEME